MFLIKNITDYFSQQKLFLIDINKNYMVCRATSSLNGLISRRAE